MITDFKSLIELIITGILDPLLFLIMGLSVLYFFWGVSLYVLHAGDESKRTEGRQVMLYGIIALTVMVSIWGLVKILTDTFGLESAIPLFPTT